MRYLKDKAPPREKKPIQRIAEASDIAARFGLDSSSMDHLSKTHHKQWVIDQMLRKLLTKSQYKSFLKEVNENVPEYLPWDKGIAP